jgi:hypothetical protein
MAENILKEPRKSTKGKTTGKSRGGFIRSLFNGSYLTNEKTPGLLNFLLFVSALAVLLIANNYLAEKKVRKIENLRDEVTELRTIYISNKAELMYLSNQSDIARRLKHKGFVESTVPPRIIREDKNRSFLLRVFQAGN